jgi:hypothetical protein
MRHNRLGSANCAWRVTFPIPVQSMLNICIYMSNFQLINHALKNSTHTVNKNKNMYLTFKFLYIKWACMNRVVHLIQNKCIKVIVTWSLILMNTFSSLNIFWRMHRAWLAYFLFNQEALLVFKVHLYFTRLFSIVISNHLLHVIFCDI